MLAKTLNGMMEPNNRFVLTCRCGNLTEAMRRCAQAIRSIDGNIQNASGIPIGDSYYCWYVFLANQRDVNHLRCRGPVWFGDFDWRIYQESTRVLHQLSVRTSDRVGRLAEITLVLSQLGCSIVQLNASSSKDGARFHVDAMVQLPESKSTLGLLRNMQVNLEMVDAQLQQIDVATNENIVLPTHLMLQ